uniref:Uncharacterized protein n=1 Tax=Moniliophthora roreri TaxID=221103 RepID=A0A0W0F2T8_MONRR
MANKTEYEGSIPEDIGTGADISPLVYLDPNSITLCIPPSQPRKSPQMIAKTEVALRNTVPLALPLPLTQSASTTEGKQERHTFCPLELQKGIPLNDSIAPNPILPIAELEALHIRDDNDPIDDEGNARNDDAGEDEEEVMILGMYDGRLDGYMAMLRDFADGLEYQQQSHDYRMLDMVERRGAPLFRLIEECRRKEQQMNSTRGTALSTWDPSTIGAMYYRGRPLTHNS